MRVHNVIHVTMEVSSVNHHSPAIAIHELVVPETLRPLVPRSRKVVQVRCRTVFKPIFLPHQLQDKLFIVLGHLLMFEHTSFCLDLNALSTTSLMHYSTSRPFMLLLLLLLNGRMSYDRRLKLR